MCLIYHKVIHKARGKLRRSTVSYYNGGNFFRFSQHFGVKTVGICCGVRSLLNLTSSILYSVCAGVLRKYHPVSQKARSSYDPDDPVFDPETQKLTQLYVLHIIGEGSIGRVYNTALQG